MVKMRLYTKEELIEVFKDIKSKGWIESGRQGNAGGVGNTIEDLYGIKENNLPIANSAEWELKSQRITNRGGNASSLTTLFHFEPSPRAVKFVPAFFLPYYGWRHEEAGIKYPASEMSFRQTISGRTRTNRGFGIAIDEDKRKVMITFDASAVSEEHHEWLKSVEKRIGLGELKPQPYWGFDDLFHKAGTKLHNCFYIESRSKKIGGKEYFKYENVVILEKFSIDSFIEAIRKDIILIDFDARTGHNHGTKFRVRPGRIKELYSEVTRL